MALWRYMINAVQNTPSEGIKLQFKHIYESPEWKNLDPICRAQLLLVAEGVKPGAMIGGNFTNFEDILTKMGLECALNTELGKLHPVYTVAKKEVLDEYFRGQITPSNGPHLHAYFHHLNGKLLGYPSCCTNEYCFPEKNWSERNKKSPHTFLSNLDFEMEEEIEKTGTYPEELDFCPPSFTPCSAHCPCAGPLLKTWMSTIRGADPAAAEELQHFHWRNSPAKKVHKKELKEIYKKWRDEIGGIIIPR